MDLFSDGKTEVHLPNAHLIYIPDFYNTTAAADLFEHFLNETPWQSDTIKLFGKTFLQPRLTALYAINNTPYTYSHLTMVPKMLTPQLVEVKHQVEQLCEHTFTTVLLNLYRNGSDSNGWHADNEKELGKNPVIASLSLGAKRTFRFKHRHLKNETYKLNLTSGSLLVMKGEMQHYWLHQIPKTKKEVSPRINLTFRTL